MIEFGLGFAAGVAIMAPLLCAALHGLHWWRHQAHIWVRRAVRTELIRKREPDRDEADWWKAL